MIINESPDTVYLKTSGITKSWKDVDAVCFSLIDSLCVYRPNATHDLLIAALFHAFKGGQQAIKEIESDGIMIKGEVNEGNKQKLNPLFDSIRSGKGGFNRNKSLQIVPDLIHGRLWKEEPKVVSFWNAEAVVKSQQKEVINFVSMFGNPREFLYDINTGAVSYEVFVGEKLKWEQKQSYLSFSRWLKLSESAANPQS